MTLLIQCSNGSVRQLIGFWWCETYAAIRSTVSLIACRSRQHSVSCKVQTERLVQRTIYGSLVISILLHDHSIAERIQKALMKKKVPVWPQFEGMQHYAYPSSMSPYFLKLKFNYRPFSKHIKFKFEKIPALMAQSDRQAGVGHQVN